MAAAAIQRLHDDFLSCIICTNLYQDPCTLTCNHTFCRECMTKFIKTRRDAMRLNYIPCPNCNHKTQVPNPDKSVEDWSKQIKPSFLIVGLMDSFASEEVQDVASSEMVKKKREAICQEHNSIMEFFCRDCQKAICQKCHTMDNRKCDNIVTLESMVPEIKSTLRATKQKMEQEVENKKSAFIQKENRLSSITAKKEQINSEITSVTNKAMNELKRKSRKLVDELENITEEEIGDLKGQMKSVEIDIQTYQQHCEYIGQVLTDDSEMDLYDIYQMCQSGAITTESSMDREQGATAMHGDLTFVEEFDQLAFGRDVQLGSIRKTRNDPKPTLLKVWDIRIEGDKRIPDPVAVTVLDVDGKETMVVADFRNKRLKSFYSRGGQTLHSSLTLSKEPSRVTKLCNNTVAVSFYLHNEIVVAKVTPELVLQSNITTEKNYRGITALNDSVLVAGCCHPSALDILDMSGQVLRTIKTEEKLIQQPQFLHTTSDGNILVSERESGSFYCLTPEGRVVFKYSTSGERALTAPRGIATTATGDILVVDKLGQKVVKLTSRGEFVRDELTSQDGLGEEPYNIYFHKNKLFLTELKRSLKVFKY